MIRVLTRFSALLILSSFISSCALNKLQLNDDIQDKTVLVNVTYANEVDSLIITAYEDELTKAISRFNKERGTLNNINAEIGRGDTSLTLNFKVQNVKIATKKAQRISFALTLLGSVAMPATLFWVQSPILFSFGYAPKNKAFIDMEASTNLNKTNSHTSASTVMKNSAGYFKSEERKVNSSAKKFGKLVYRGLKRLNKTKKK